MDSVFYQACYTRIGPHSKKDVAERKEISAGYQNVHCSPNMPRSVLSAFESRRKTISSNTHSNVRDKGLAFFFDNNICGIEYVRYDCSDEKGRGVIFDQSFLFQDAYSLLKHPEEFFYIKDSNFGTNIEKWELDDPIFKEQEGTIRWCLRHTAEIPTFLETDGLSTEIIDSAQIAEKYGIDEKKLKYFLYSVCFQLLSTDASRTLFVKTDGSLQMMRDLAYILFIHFPYSLRTKISCGEYCYQNQNNCSLMFTDKIPEPDKQPYIDPIAGTGNVFKNRQQEDNVGNRFPYVAHSALLSDSERIEYYTSLEEAADKLGIGRSQDRSCLMLAHQLVTEAYNDPEMTADVLYDLLALPVVHNEAWEGMVTSLLSAVVNYSIVLPNTTKEMLSVLLRNDERRQYTGILIRYEAAQLLEKNSEVSSKMLLQYDKEDETYIQLVESLADSDRGQEILHRLYELRLEVLLESGTCPSPEQLIIAGQELGIVRNNRDLIDRVKKKAYEQSEQLLIEKPESYDLTLRNLMDLLYRIDNGTDQDTNHVLKKRFLDTFNHRFIANLDQDLYAKGVYDSFYRVYGQYYPEEKDLLCAMREIDNDSYSFVTDYLSEKLSRTRKGTVVGHLLTRVRTLEKTGEYYVPITFWKSLARSADADPVGLMVKVKALILFDSFVLDNDLLENCDDWDDDFFFGFYDTVRAYVKADKTLKSKLHDSLIVLKEEKRERKGAKKISFKRKGLFG